VPAQASNYLPWYAIHTRSHFEQRIVSELAAKGFETYLPGYEEIHQWKDRKKKVLVPLFPGYVFSRFEATPDFRVRVAQTSGVVRILGREGEAEPVPEAEIEAIRTLLNAKVPCFAHPFLREGCRVRVKRGALKGVEGILVRFKNTARLVVSVTLLSQSVAVEVAAADVELLPQR
jgi:transcription antitermination factor NusG